MSPGPEQHFAWLSCFCSACGCVQQRGRQTVLTIVTTHSLFIDWSQTWSFRRCFQSLGLVWKKLNLTQQKLTFTNQRNVLQHRINTKKLKPGLVAFYVIRPGNGVGLFSKEKISKESEYKRYIWVLTGWCCSAWRTSQWRPVTEVCLTVSFYWQILVFLMAIFPRRIHREAEKRNQFSFVCSFLILDRICWVFHIC